LHAAETRAAERRRGRACESNQQPLCCRRSRDVNMNNRIAPALLAAACVSLLASCASNNSRSTQPQTRIVQAADGLNLVCEVRGSADTALVFLHGWGGDRH